MPTPRSSVDAYLRNVREGSEGGWRERLEQIEALVRSDAAAGKPGRGLTVTMKNLPAGGLIAWQILNGSGDPWFLVDRLRAYAALWFSFLEPRKVVGPYNIATSTFSAIASGRVDRIQKLANIGALRMTEGRYPAAYLSTCRTRSVEVPSRDGGIRPESGATRRAVSRLPLDLHNRR